jgi:hypothetical protein
VTLKTRLHRLISDDVHKQLHAPTALHAHSSEELLVVDSVSLVISAADDFGCVDNGEPMDRRSGGCRA